MKWGTTYRVNTTGLLGHVSYWTWSWKVSVTRAAVHMRRMGKEPQTGHRECHSWMPGQE